MIRDFSRSPAAVVALPAVLLTLFYLSRQAVGPDYYGLARLAQAASASAIVAPICSGLAAWEGWRLQSARVGALAPARSEAGIAIRALAPMGLLALAAFTAGVGSMLSSATHVGLRDATLLVVPASVVAGHAALAYAAGRALPGVLSIPLSVVASWLWIVYPISLEPVWLRHLTGYLSTCCDTATVLAPGAFLAPIGIGIAACAAAGFLMSRLSLVVRAGCAAGALALAVAGGVLLVDDLGSEPTAARPAADLVCRGADPRVCVWPEHEHGGRLLMARAHRIRTQLRAAGVRTPSRVSEGTPAVWRVGLAPGAGAEEIDASLIEGLLPPLPPCPRGMPYLAGRVYWPVTLWLADLAGVSARPFRYSVSAADRRETAAARAAPRQMALAWYRANVDALARCGSEPRILSDG